MKCGLFCNKESCSFSTLFPTFSFHCKLNIELFVLRLKRFDDESIDKFVFSPCVMLKFDAEQFFLFVCVLCYYSFLFSCSVNVQTQLIFFI